MEKIYSRASTLSAAPITLFYRLALFPLILSSPGIATADDPPFTYRIDIEVGETGYQGILNNLCRDNEGNPYVESYTDYPTWQTPKPPSVTLSHVPTQLMTFSPEYQHFETTLETPPGEYRIHWNSQDSEHCNNWYWNQIVDVKPILSIDKDVIWWFKSQKPAGFETKATVSAIGSPGPYKWKIESGTNVVEFPNHSSTYETAENKTTITGKAGVSDVEYYARLSVTVNGEKSEEKTIVVRRPWKLVNQINKDDPDSTWGYLTTIKYTIEDNLGAVLPGDVLVPYHEEFTGSLEPDYPGENWRASVPNGSMQFSDNIVDTIGGEHLSRDNTPTPLPPQKPRGTVKVDHQRGRLVVGTDQSAGGVPVMDLTWQKYQDHGRHQKLVTPLP